MIKNFIGIFKSALVNCDVLINLFVLIIILLLTRKPKELGKTRIKLGYYCCTRNLKLLKINLSKIINLQLLS